MSEKVKKPLPITRYNITNLPVTHYEIIQFFS
jgi:hypothetical protein